MFLLDCESKGCFAICFCVDIRAVSQQQFDHFYMPILGCAVEWSEIAGLFCVRIRSTRQESLRDRQMLPGWASTSSFTRSSWPTADASKMFSCALLATNNCAMAGRPW